MPSKWQAPPLRRVHAKWHEVNIVVTQNKIVHKSQT